MNKHLGTLKRAIAKFGEQAQIGLVIEELAELIVAISHFERQRVDHEALAGEMADVTIMLKQLQLISGIQDDDIEEMIDQKIKRLLEGVGD